MIDFLKNKYYRSRPMVKYWKTADAVEAKVVREKEGHYQMYMQGEDYPFPGYPRGSLLYGKLSPLKHWIKNKVFNDTWAMLEDKKSSEEITKYLKEVAYPYVFEIAEDAKYDMVPLEVMNPPVRELYRALTKVSDGDTVNKWRDIITFIFQEDDGYRMRFQWMTKFLPKFRKPTVEDFMYALKMHEDGESVGDMKEKARLILRVMKEILNDPKSLATFKALLKECDWKKLKLTEADLYFLRAKYFKADYPEYAY